MSVQPVSNDAAPLHALTRYSIDDVHRCCRQEVVFSHSFASDKPVLDFLTLYAYLLRQHPTRHDRVEYDTDGKPARLYPFTRTPVPDVHAPKLIAIDPKFGFGMPIFARTNLRCDVFAERYAAGESLKSLIADYTDVTQEEAEEAIRYYTVTQ